MHKRAGHARLTRMVRHSAVASGKSVGPRAHACGARFSRFECESAKKANRADKYRLSPCKFCELKLILTLALLVMRDAKLVCYNKFEKQALPKLR